MTELLELDGPAVTCRRCGHGYPDHEDGGGHCRGTISNGPSYRLACMCPAMQWVDPDGRSVGSYTDPPQRP